MFQIHCLNKKKGKSTPSPGAAIKICVNSKARGINFNELSADLAQITYLGRGFGGWFGMVFACFCEDMFKLTSRLPVWGFEIWVEIHRHVVGFGLRSTRCVMAAADKPHNPAALASPARFEFPFRIPQLEAMCEGGTFETPMILTTS